MSNQLKTVKLSEEEVKLFYTHGNIFYKEKDGIYQPCSIYEEIHSVFNSSGEKVRYATNVEVEEYSIAIFNKPFPLPVLKGKMFGLVSTSEDWTYSKENSFPTLHTSKKIYIFKVEDDLELTFVKSEPFLTSD